MAPITLEGNSLGQRHRNYNRLLKEALASNQGATPDKISHDDNDIDNFLKIDIASHNRDVAYILEVLKCKDLLYVTRAIKKSRWLITDDSYSHIINPKYLHKELFPHMMSKAKSKLLLHIRLYLRDEKRVAHFYNYTKQFDLDLAMKWLQYCPLQFALNEFHNHVEKVTLSTFERLCRRSFDFLDKVAAYSKLPNWRKGYYLFEVQFLVRHKTEEYLNMADSFCEGYINFLKKKHFHYVMKTCPERIFNNLFYYIQRVDHTMLIQYMDKESIKQCLMKCSEHEDVFMFKKISSFDVLENFLPKIEFSDRIAVLKAFYVTTSKIDWQDPGGLNSFFSAINDYAPINSPNVFRWYQCMPFDVAYRELTKLIQKESNRDVRLSMINTLLKCAGCDFRNISILLKYFHDTHINELNNFKANFVNQILSRVAINKFDTEMWTVLDNLLCSMDVYKNSSSNVSKYVQTIIVYKTIHDQIVPEIIESKFKFKTLKYFKRKLNAEECEKLFNYLYKKQVKNIENNTESNLSHISTEKELKNVVDSLGLTLKLLADWNKNIVDYPMIFDKIRACIKINKQNSWDIDLSTLYNIHKQWRRYFFDDSLMLNPSKQVLINVLKHNYEILNMYQKEVDLIRLDDTISLQLLLCKIKIYWADTLAKEWIGEYLFHLNDKGKQKMAIQSLAVLLSQKEFLNIVKKHLPEESKINWKEADEIECNYRKNFAIYIHRVRPLPDMDVVLWFAKDDNLKFAVTSIKATFANLSDVDREDYISTLTGAPLSLQKHGIHMAFAILDVEKLKPIFETIWKSTTNPNIQTNLFLTTHNLLCKQSKKSRILKMWELLDFFIDNLSDRDNSTIIHKLSALYEVPEIVQSKYCKKVYRYFKTLPKHDAQADNMIVMHAGTVVEKLDGKFIEDFILEVIENYSSKPCYIAELFAKYLLSVNGKESELDTYERLVKPLFHNTEYYPSFTSMVFGYLPSHFRDYVLKNKRVPVNLFQRLQNDFKQKLSLPDDYVSLRTLELMCDLVKILEHHISPHVDYSDNFDEVLKIPVLSDFGKTCTKHLQRDTKTFAYTIFAFEYALMNLFSAFFFSTFHRLQTYKHMLGDQSIVESYLIVQRAIQENVYADDEKKVKDEIIAMLCCHPSAELKMICQRCYLDKTQVILNKTEM